MRLKHGKIREIINTPFGKAEVIMVENEMSEIDIWMSKERYEELLGPTPPVRKQLPPD